MTTAPARPWRPGTIIEGKHNLVALLGEGGQGCVYEATNVNIGKHVAIKLLHPAFAQREDVVERFQREARVIIRINHPNIVEVFDTGIDKETGSIFTVSELLRGHNLFELLRNQGCFDSNDALDLLLPVMDGLASTHAASVVHRDVKPENIFIAVDA